MNIFDKKTAYTNKFKRLSDNDLEKYLKNPLCKSILISSMGYYTEHQTKNHFASKPASIEATIHYCIKGKGKLYINNTEHEINSGDIFICPPNISHAYCSNKTNPWNIIWAYFLGNDISYFLDIIHYTLDNPVINIGFNPKIIGLFNDAISNYFFSNNINHIIYSSQCIKELLSYLSIYHSKNNNKDILYIEDTIEYMNQNIENNLKLKDISNRYNLSKDYFSKKFKKITGSSPIDYFIMLKIQYACALLETTSLPIYEISKKLGYTDTYYFSRIFKKKIGYSPKYYRLKIAVLK